MSEHEYMRRLNLAIKKGLLNKISPGGIKTDVTHDDDCAIFRGGVCSCDCIITIKAKEGAFEILKDGSLERAT